MLVFRTLILPCVILCLPSFLLVEAQLVRDITLPGMNIQALRYDYDTDFLFFSDIDEKTIHRYDPFSLTDQILQLDQKAAFIILVRDKPYKFLAGLDRDIVLLDWDYSSSPNINGTYAYFTCLLIRVDAVCPGNWWNTGTVDGYGNLWTGMLTTLDPSDCSCSPNLYRALTTKPSLLTADVAIQSFYSNGIEFTADYRVMYTIDYYNRQVYSFHFDLPRSIISCPKVVFRYDDNNLSGSPKGIAKDSQGNLWIGSLGGSQVIQINPNTGELLQTVTVPASRVTAVAFGGRFNNVLFVGTMASDNSSLEPLSGSVFAISGLGVNGVEEKQAVINNFCKPMYS